MKRTNYIGSTIDIKKRFRDHKYNCYNKNSVQYYYKVYKHIRANSLTIKPKIYATYKVNGTKEFNQKMKRLVEQFYIDKYDTINNGLNTIKAFANAKDNKEQINENKRKYYLNNKDEINKLRRNGKVKCEKCKLDVCRKDYLATHQRTNKCKRIYNKNIMKYYNETKEAN